jgi:hypothetical protein
MEWLAEIGCDAVGPAYTISEARRLALGGTFDAAIIDWNMRGSVWTEIADILSNRQIPFLVVTGYTELPSEARPTGVLIKPFTCEELQEAVQNLLSPQIGSRHQSHMRQQPASLRLRWMSRAWRTTGSDATGRLRSLARCPLLPRWMQSQVRESCTRSSNSSSARRNPALIRSPSGTPYLSKTPSLRSLDPSRGGGRCARAVQRGSDHRDPEGAPSGNSR